MWQSHIIFCDIMAHNVKESHMAVKEMMGGVNDEKHQI